MMGRIPELIQESSTDQSEESPEHRRVRAADLSGFLGIEEETKGLILKKTRKASEPPAAFGERQIAQKILKELLEMLEDEENYVKIEAYEQLGNMFQNF